LAPIREPVILQAFTRFLSADLQVGRNNVDLDENWSRHQKIH
jgi:hypothetical protein